jgi:UDP-glucose 4-epimerase
MSKILITGGSGFLGKHLASALKEEHSVILASRNQKALLSAAHLLKVDSVPLDVSNYASTVEIFSRYSPEIVIHAAATKFVDLAEKFPNECIDINVLGSQNVARAAMETKVDHVLGVSTDKAAPPIANIYGLSKAIMEKLFVSLNGTTETSFSCVRYGNVAWSTGSVFPIWKRMIEENSHIVTTGPNMSRFFFPVGQAVELILTALNHKLDVSGKILSIPMKGVEVSRILDAWTALSGATWSVGERRVGDRELEYLISESEASSTTLVDFENKPYFLLNGIGAVSKNPLTQNYSSRNAEQFTEEEIHELLINPPKNEML